jgi:hypothetical protein
VFTDPFFKSNSTKKMNIWMLSTHTHQWGKDYDIYMRNPDGTKGEQIYEGFYNRDYTFNQGYYDWAHPAIREFYPLKPVLLKEGLIHEAVFNNTGNSTATFGLTTNDEMMLITVQYTLSDMNAGVEEEKETVEFNAYPNPTNGMLYGSFYLPPGQNLDVALYDMMGRKVKTFFSGQHSSGTQSLRFDFRNSGLEPGNYFLRLEHQDGVEVKKVVYLR